MQPNKIYMNSLHNFNDYNLVNGIKHYVKITTKNIKFCIFLCNIFIVF